MKNLRPRLVLLAAALALGASSATARPAARPVVQIALLLDTSNSMDGLIDQARSRLWRVVNDLAEARCDGVRPRLEVALYEYGNSRLSPESGYIREVCAFTGDLDHVSASLFALRTHGGDEYCGAVVDRALRRLGWSGRRDDLRMIFIAGNEPFTQGPVDFRPVMREAAARGITVNTIFCGPEREGVLTHWKSGADAAFGTFAAIRHDRPLPRIDAPQDRELALLNDRLNRTYLAYGTDGAARAENQRRQDANAAASAPAAIAGRISTKAGSLYRNSSWDLVDALEEGAIDPGKLAAAELPAELRDLPAAERREKIEAAAAERAEIQARIRDLAAGRERHIAAELGKLPDAEPDAFDEAVRKSVRAQAAKKNYVFAND